MSIVTANVQYGAAVTHTITLTSLASDTQLFAGRASTAIDNKDTDFAVDALVGGKITTGTSPTATRLIEIWSYGSYDDISFSAGITGSDGAANTSGQKTLLKLLTVIPTVGTSNSTYTWGPFSVAQAFGGILPSQWGTYIVHNTGVNLNATSSFHEVKHIPVKFQSA